MTWEIVNMLFKEHGFYVLAISVLGWAYWQERKQNMKSAELDKVDSKAMVVALIEFKSELHQFKEALERRFARE